MKPGLTRYLRGLRLGLWADRIHVSGSGVPMFVRGVCATILLGAVMIALEDGSPFIAAVAAIPTLPMLTWRRGASIDLSRRVAILWKGVGLGGPLFVPLARESVDFERARGLVLVAQPSGWSGPWRTSTGRHHELRDATC